MWSDEQTNGHTNMAKNTAKYFKLLVVKGHQNSHGPNQYLNHVQPTYKSVVNGRSYKLLI
jgi:hypothetical protein